MNGEQRGAKSGGTRPPLSPTKQALLELWGRQLAQGELKLGTIAAHGSENYPLSSAQKRLWFLHQLEPAHPFYNVATALTLRGSLRVDALSRALNGLLRRHQVLRMRIDAGAGEPMAVADEDVRVALPEAELSPNMHEDKAAELERRIRQEVRLPFDLGAAPLLRALLLRVGPGEHVLVLTLHHLVCDGWSMQILIGELAELYAAEVEGRPPVLPRLPIQYGDFAEWERGQLQGEILDRQVAYWKRQLANAPDVLDLPTDRPRPAWPSFEGGQDRLRMPDTIVSAWRELNQREGVTLFMSGLAAFSALLSRYSSQTDIVVGSPVANRDQPDLEGLIGFFVNTLALRVDLSGDPTFRDLLARVRETTLEAYSHPGLPFEQLVSLLHPERDLSRNPVFQIMFATQTEPDLELSLAGLELAAREVETGTSKVDLVFGIQELTGGLQAIVQYSSDLFEASTIERMALHFRNLVAAAVARPDAPLSELDMMDEQERQQLVEGRDQTTVARPSQATASALFEDQVDRRPSALAVEASGHQLSYRELNVRANRLAHFLASLGVDRGSLVGVFMDRGVDLVVSLLAILKAGAAYVPMATDYPSSRLSFMVADSGAKVVLTQRPLLALLPATDCHVVCLEDYWSEAWRWPEQNMGAMAGPGDAGYVIYTSGSTGQPKGVQVTNGGLDNLISWHRHAFGVTDADRATLVASPSFDASAWEMWPYLVAGASLHVPPDSVRLQPTLLRDWLVARRISICFLPTPMAEAMLELDWPEETSLRTLLTGGDRLHQEPPADLPFALVNNYGPTECTVVTTSGVVRRRGGGQLPAIGRAIENVQTLVLDEAMRPVPVGIPGELYIGGAGLARGYHRRSDLTAERFVPNPFDRKPGQRLYRSGDLVRWLPDGNLEFLGRLDRQVKVRGFRIELAEIEAVLSQHPALAAALVEVIEESPGDRRLVGYVVPAGQEPPTKEEIRDYLGERLPSYMVPGTYVWLNAFPVTPNGKVDRRALSALSTASLRKQQEGPRYPEEVRLAAMWKELLRVESVDVDDDFFDLGGDSLLATRMVTRIQLETGLELPLRRVFEAPRLRDIAAELASRKASRAGPAIVWMGRDSNRFVLSSPQQRLWFLDRLTPSRAEYNIPIALRLSGVLDPAALSRALDQLVARHETLRTRFEVDDGRPWQVIMPPTRLPVGFHDLSSPPIGERELLAGELALAEAGRPFDLESGSLFRATLLKLAPTEHRLLLTLHHIVADGWSLGVLARDLDQLYSTQAGSSEPALAALPIQYADFASWQQAWLRTPLLNQQLAYWRERLAGTQPLDLPTDRRRPPVRSGRGHVCHFSIEPALAEALRELSRQAGVTLFMTLLAGFGSLLYRHSGQTDLIVGSPIANRGRPELEGLIGFFANTLALRLDLAGDPSFRELLGRVREMALDAYANQDVPFEMLVESLGLERSLGRTPLFQVMFTLQSGLATPWALGDMSVQELHLHSGTAKFDLTMALVEGQDGGLVGELEYSTDLYLHESAERLVDQYQKLLAASVSQPTRRVSELPLLDPGERRDLLDSWAREPGRVVRERCVHELVEESASRAPDAVAVTAEEDALSYGQLDRRGNQLARHLQLLGVGPEVRVGVCLERGTDMVVGLLGILKAGGAYVPLEPGLPRERLHYQLQDAGVGLVVSHGKVATRLVAEGVRVLRLDAKAISDERSEPVVSGVRDQNVAYVIYTSGSTGEPKGVMVSHRHVIRLLDETQRWFQFGSRDIWSCFHSYAFDFSVWEIWGCLGTGGRLVMASHAQSRSPGDFHRLLEQEQVTVLNQTPSAFRQLIGAAEAMSGNRQTSLRLVIFGGEALEPHSLEGWWRLYTEGRPRLVNMYGITETTVHVTYRELSRTDLELSVSPIGRPIPDLELLVLDQHLEPVPLGVPGELFVAGEGLARGYLGRPGQTAERFLPNPHGRKPGERLYRSGDVGRQLADREVEYLGRTDNQVKVRGFRIELGEVEAVLSRHPQIKEAVVVVDERQEEGHRLIAYLVPTSPDPPSLGYRRFLQDRLPDYMLPAAFVSLDRLPLTPNGKLDRRALPPADTGRVLEAHTIPPRDTTELRLAQLWSELLQLGPVGVNDNFFEVGGHSLLAVQLIAAIERTFGRKLALSTLFQSPTVAALASILREQVSAPPSTLVAIRPSGSGLPLFLVHPMGGSVGCYVDLAYRMGPDRPIFALQARGIEADEEPRRGVEEMAEAYLAALLPVQPRGPYALAGWSFGGVVAFEMGRQLGNRGQKVELVALIDSVAAHDHQWAASELDLLGVIARDLAGTVGVELGVDWQSLTELLDAAKRADVLPADMPMAQLQRLLDVYTCHARALDAYRPAHSSFPLRLFRARQGPLASSKDPVGGWAALAGSVEVEWVEGDHFSLLRAPHVDALAARLTELTASGADC